MKVLCDNEVQCVSGGMSVPVFWAGPWWVNNPRFAVQPVMPPPSPLLAPSAPALLV